MALEPTVEMLVLGPEPVHRSSMRDGVWREHTARGQSSSIGRPSPGAPTTGDQTPTDLDVADDEEGSLDEEEPRQGLLSVIEDGDEGGKLAAER